MTKTSRVYKIEMLIRNHGQVSFRRLLDELEPSSVLLMGDDRGDAEGFLVLREARASGRLAAALSVGVHDRVATPPEVIAAADVMLPSPRAAARLLSALAIRLERG